MVSKFVKFFIANKTTFTILSFVFAVFASQPPTGF